MVATTAVPHQRAPLIALFTSHGTVHFSVLLAMVAIPWFVLETTGSASRTGLTAAVQGVPMIFAGIFGGVIVDRLGFRRTAIISDALSGVAFGMIPLLYFTTGITFWQLLVFVFLGSLFDTPGFTARLSMMPDMAYRAGVRLERANSISQTLAQGSILLAPALAGILIGVIGASAVLWINTVLFFVSVAAVGTFIPAYAPSPQSAVQSRGRYLGELKSGISFVFNSKLILALILSVTMIQFLRANLMVIMPVYAHDFFGNPSEFGFMFAAMGGGGLITAILYGIWGHRWPRRPIILIGVSSMSLAFWLLAATPAYWMILAGLFVIGLMNGPMIPLIFTLMQESTPSDLRGRVFGLYDAAMFGAMVPGRLLAGYLIEWTSIVQTLVIVGGAYLVAVAGIVSNPHLHQVSQSAGTVEEDAAIATGEGEQSPQEAGR
jgi:MFS family permease